MKNEFAGKLLELWKNFCSLSVSFVLAIVSTRAFEALLTSRYNIVTDNVLAFNLTGLFYDIVLYLKILPVLFLAFALTGWFKERLARLIINVLHIVLLVISISLIIYFCSAGMPLDKVFVYYSRKELLHIIGASQTTYIWAYLCLAIIPILYLIFTKLIRKISGLAAVLCLLPLMACFFIRTPEADSFDDKKEFYIKKNKIEYFFDSFERVLSVAGIDEVIKEETVLYELYPDFDFVDPNYPFLYKDNASDVLSPFFDMGDKKPNIVVFVVEGLARENSGNNSIFVSSTPFLDSLSQHALCWDNCFSTSPRTCAVMPSLLGSLPYGKSGFMSYGNNVPEFISLPKIMKDNGYKFSFFYGGWLGFDDMEYFIRNNDVDVLLDYTLHKTHERRNTWGLLDDAMIDEAVKTLGAAGQPRLDVYLTLSTHDPWDYPNADAYKARYKASATDEKPINGRNPDGAAAYLYADDCIRKLINEYKKRDDFDNTIFVFTGDHNFQQSEYLHQYRVPFVIWSPMLKRAATFEPIVSHRDFTPSILALLKHHYHVKTPDEVTWLSKGLDTVREFRSKTIVPHITYSRNISGMFCGDYLIQDKNVYKLVYNDNDVEMIKDENADSLIKYLNAYKILDNYVFEYDALVENDYNSLDFHVIADKVEDNGLSMVTFADRDDVIECDRVDIPFVVMRTPIENDYKCMKINVSFDIFMHQDEEKPYSSVKLEILRKPDNGEMVYMSTEFVDLYRVGGYDKWQHWSIDEFLKHKKYHYKAGDVLVVRFSNFDKLPFYLSNVKATLSASK